MENKAVSNLTSSLVFEELKEQEDPHHFYVERLPSHLVKPRHLSISNAVIDIQPVRQVIKVNGTITVSF